VLPGRKLRLKVAGKTREKKKRERFSTPATPVMWSTKKKGRAKNSAKRLQNGKKKTAPDGSPGRGRHGGRTKKKGEGGKREKISQRAESKKPPLVVRCGLTDTAIGLIGRDTYSGKEGGEGRGKGMRRGPGVGSVGSGSKRLTL